METETTPSPAAGENRVAIIGAGHVGATTAYALLQSTLVRDILLLDSDAEKAEGEAMDLSHAVPLGPPVSVRAGTYAEAAESAIVVVTAGAGSTPGESRLDLLERNAPIVRDCVTQLRENGFDGILIVVTNPADVLTQVAQEASGLPPERVIGSGTLIDTARLRQVLGEALKIDPRAVEAFIVGEHGDSEVAAFSCAHIAGVALSDFAAGSDPPTVLDYDAIQTQVRRAAPKVVERKGNTEFAIASSVREICEAILRDEKTVLAVSTRLSGQYGGLPNVYLGTPCVVGAEGVERVLELPLSDTELTALRHSAEILAEAVASVSQDGGGEK
ncbi:MAG: L-lactate dehydrogenase [Armatimonadota bacterium]